MLKILSENDEILVRTGSGESLWSQRNELRQVCAAAIGTIAQDHDVPPDKVMGGFLIMLEDDDDWKPILLEVNEFNKGEKCDDWNRS